MVSKFIPCMAYIPFNPYMAYRVTIVFGLGLQLG